PKTKLDGLISEIRSGSVESWRNVHEHYHAWSREYLDDKFQHALASLQSISNRDVQTWDNSFVKDNLQEAVRTGEWIFSEIERSRTKDYQNPFKLMVYESYEEMEEVVGKLVDNDFINKERNALAAFQQEVQQIIDKL